MFERCSDHLGKIWNAPAKIKLPNVILHRSYTESESPTSELKGHLGFDFRCVVAGMASPSVLGDLSDGTDTFAINLHRH